MITILCAAIHYDDGNVYESQPVNINTGYVVCGWRHFNIGALHFQMGLATESVEEVEGFLTSDNKFVNRQEAAIIAMASGQIKELNYQNTELFSEDLY